MKYLQTEFGKLPDGRAVKLFKFEAADGLKVFISNYGGIITSIQAPDKHGHLAEITTGFPVLKPYLEEHPYFGAIIGRYANRIAGGQFMVDGKRYDLHINNGPNHLHGGKEGFDKKLWDAYPVIEHSNASVLLKYKSPDLEEGYPGNLDVSVKYRVHDNNSIEIEYEATCDTATHVNLTNHTYFNLNGFTGNVFDHSLWLRAAQYLENDPNQIPTGKYINCNGTSFDFHKKLMKGIPGQKVSAQMDHCFVVNKNGSIDEPVAVLYHPGSGRRLTVCGTQPGIQVYTSNFLDVSFSGHNGTVYKKNMAICLESQHFPNTPNTPGFPETLIKPGQKYRQALKWHFDHTS